MNHVVFFIDVLLLQGMKSDSLFVSKIPFLSLYIEEHNSWK